PPGRGGGDCVIRNRGRVAVTERGNQRGGSSVQCAVGSRSAFRPGGQGCGVGSEATSAQDSQGCASRQRNDPERGDPSGWRRRSDQGGQGACGSAGAGSLGDVRPGAGGMRKTGFLLPLRLPAEGAFAL